MGEIVFIDQMPVAQCPACRGQEWTIRLERVAKGFRRVSAFECANRECPFTVSFEPIDLFNDELSETGTTL